MPKYLVQASYVGDGVQGLRQEGGSARRAAVEKACSSVGGKLEAFYYAFGETDVVTVIDLPDNVDRGRGRSAYRRERQGRRQDHRSVESGRSRRCRKGGRRLPPTRGLSTGILTPFRTVPSGSRAVPLFGSGTLSGALWSGPKIRRTIGVPNRETHRSARPGKASRWAEVRT